MKTKNRILSVILSLALAIPAVPSGFTGKTAEASTVNPIAVTVENAGGNLNLTQVGDLDWMHITSEKINRKATAGVAVHKIGFELLKKDEPMSTLKDSPITYEWSDGTPTASGTAIKTGGVVVYKGATEAGVIKEEVGYRIQIPAESYPQTLTFASGVWNADAEIAVYVNGKPESVYSNKELTAGGSVVNKKYTINIRSGNAVEVKCRLKLKRHKSGNVNITGITLGRMGIPEAVKVDVKTANGSMDLTQMGNIDWLHITATKNNDSVFTRKDIISSQIQFEMFKDNDKISRQTDSKVSFNWSDGVPTASGEAIRLGGVMNYKAGSFQGAIPESDRAGYKISVDAHNSARKLTFVSGVWQAKGDISIYLNGDKKAVYSVPLEAGKDAVANIYTISLSAGDSAVVEFDLKSKSHKHGNICIGAITLGTDSEGFNFKIKLEQLLKEAQIYDLEGILPYFSNQLKAEMENAQKVLALPTQGNEVYFEAYQYLKAAYDAVLSNAQDRNYSYVTNPELVSSFGWEGDKDAPISYIDGSYHLRDREGRMINFGVWEIPGKIAWYNKEGYLPCFVSEFEKNQLKHSIENFADMVEVEGKKFEIAYSRMTTTNTSKTVMNLPKVSAGLIPLNEAAAVQKEVAPGETVIREYAIGADRFGGTYAYPTDEKIKALGSWDTHYEHMKQYWNTRINGVIDIKALPTGYEELINAYKAGYIYTLLIADDYKLHVGENGYDRVFDHDAMGIIATLVTMGDFRNFDAYANHAMDNIQYPDAFWKYSWPYAVYLVKTGETDYIAGKFDKIKDATHRIETERVKFGTVKDVDGNDARIMKQTKAVDSLGYWLIDNWSGLTGLTTYRYICDTLYEKTKTESYKTESQWALSEYDSLLKSTEAVLKSTMKEYSFDYLPMAMDVPNELSVRKDPRDANWAAHFLFGRWSWDGYLFGADQNSFMLDMIDQTYTYGIERRKKEGVSDSMYNFGGYPHGYYCSAYNAGYGSAGLKGEQYRDMGIEAYKFMIENAMSGPFGWWEGVDYQDANSPWDRTHAKGGGGSCQHMWGQSTATKVLIDALITEKADGNIIVGRGIPKSWITEGEKVEFSNYPIENKKRMGYQLTTKGKNVVLELSGDAPTKEISFELMSFVNNIASAEGLSFDNAKGSVNIPAGTKKVTVTLKEAPKKYTVSFDTKGGSSVPEQMVAAGEKVQKPSDPTKNGYEFIGWYQGNTKYDFDAPVKEALTLTAKWEEVVIPTPDYPNNGGNTMKEETVLEDLKDKVAEELKKEEGKRSEIKIDLKGKTELPKSVLEEIKGKDIVISIQLGEGMKWILNGKDMIGKDLKTIDLSVKEDSGNIPKEEMEQLLGKNSGTQISMENKENFGFKATLELSMDKENGKAIANVYSYNKKTKEFTLQTTGKVDENGKVKLTFTRTSDYVIMLADKVAITEDILEKSKNNVSKKTLYTQKDKGNTKRIKVTLPRVVREAISNELLSKEKITYTSSNKKIAVVSSKGNVRAVKPGKVTIYAHIKIDGVKTVLKTKVQVKK